MHLSGYVAGVVAGTLTLASLPASAAPACADTQLSEGALALKNAALELRDAGSWAKAARSFRDAADELSPCPELDDVRLRWSLWAVEAFEKAPASPEDRESMGDFVARQLAILQGHTESADLADLPQLHAARERLRPDTAEKPAEVQGASPPAPSAGPSSSKAPVALIGTGSALLVPSLVLVGAMKAKSAQLSEQLNGAGGIYDQMNEEMCGVLPDEDSPGSDSAQCDALREARSRIRDDGRLVNAIGYTAIATSVVGGVLAITGIALLVRARKRARGGLQSRLQLMPTFGGAHLSGHF